MARCSAREGAARRGRRIGLFCGFGGGNIGNHASLEVAARVITEEHPNEQLVIITPFVDGARLRTSLPVIEMNPSMRAAMALNAHRVVKLGYFVVRETFETVRRLRTVACLDGVIAPGTGLLDDYAESPAGMPYAVLAWTLAAKLTRRPFLMVGIGAGPLVNRASRLQMRLAARLATEVSYRDEASRSYMAGLDPRIGEEAVVCDLVFADVWPDAHSANVQDVTSQALTIGVGVMAYGSWAGDDWTAANLDPVFERYIGEMARVVRGVIADGHEVRLLVGQPIDDIAVNAVMANLSEAEMAHVVFEQTREFVDLLSEVARTSIVVATRYHNIVAALMMRRPVVSVSYAVKNAALLERVGMTGRDRSIEDFDADWVLAQIRELVASGAEISPVADSVLDCWRRLAFESVRRAARRVDSDAHHRTHHRNR